MSPDRHDDAFADQVELYVLGTLSEQERIEFENHLASGCAQCEQQLATCLKVAEAMLRLIPPAAPPAEFRAQLMARVEQACAAESEQRPGAETGPLADSGAHVLRAGQGEWTDTPYSGVQFRMLFVDRQRRQFTALVRMAPGSHYPPHSHQAAEECLVLEGDLRLGDCVLRAGDFLRTAPGYQQGVQTTAEGCLLYLTSPID